jgi:hypothetical protein
MKRIPKEWIPVLYIGRKTVGWITPSGKVYQIWNGRLVLMQETVTSEGEYDGRSGTPR